MTGRIFRSKNEPDRKGLSWQERWQGPDRGLITSWEVGRHNRVEKPELAERVSKGELPVLGWKGGVDKALKSKVFKWGSLHYLAQWQGLRGEDLDIDPSEETSLVCSRTFQGVTYTADRKKLANP